MKTILTKFAVIWEHLSKKGPKSSFLSTISSNITASKEKEKRKKSQLGARKQEKRKRKRKKKKGCTNRE